MRGSQSDRPGNVDYDSEYGEGPADATRRTQTTTTVRGSSAEEHETLRLGSEQGALRSRPSWQARYAEHGELGRGGMAAIRAVFDRVIGRRLAMKVLGAQLEPGALEAFVEEARITGQLEHPNIAPVYDLQQDEDGLPTRFTMKLVEGTTLAQLLEEQDDSGPSSESLERMLAVFLKVCDAVAFAHSRGVIHRDLKPSNIMVGSHGQVYVMDWGVARRLRPDPALSQHESSATASAPELEGSLSGTPAYMAPEQAWGHVDDVDERSDVYGLGGLLYAILTRRPPHASGDPMEDLHLAKQGRVIPPQEAAPLRSLPPALCRIAMRALAPDKADRYASAEELSREVERFARGGGWFEQVRYAKGDVVLREGDAPDAAYIILEGHCELFRERGGERKFMRLLGAGEVFGETSIFGSSARTASIVASSDVTLLRVTRSALERELDRSQWLRAFVEALAERFIELDQRLRRLQDDQT